jgi:hypothetical protein
VNADRLPSHLPPVGSAHAVHDDIRQRAIDSAQDLMAEGRVDLETFQRAVDGLLAARSDDDIAMVVRSLPPPVAFTSPGRRRHEPLEINAPMGEVRLEGRWQVGRHTTIETGMGSVTIDLTEAEFDDWEVEIGVRTTMGSIAVIAPEGFDVRSVGRSGAVESSLGPAVPGFPVVLLRAFSDMGSIRVVHSAQQLRRRGRKGRRRGRESRRG